MAAALCLGLGLLMSLLHSSLSSLPPSPSHSSPSCPRSGSAGERALCSLLADLRAVRGRGGGTRGEDICRYRLEKGGSWHRYAGEAGLELQEVLVEYGRMHRECTALEHGRLREFVAERRKARCKYLVWSCTFGLGNKFMSLTSAFLVAILSKRVLLVDHPGWEGLLCEPFAGSKWQVPRGFSLKDDFDSPSFAEFREKGCGHASGRQDNNRCNSSVVTVVFSSDMDASDYSFLACPSEMARVRNVPFLNFRNSNQQFAVGFYLNPAVRPLLEILFPERNLFHLLARSLYFPSDEVWEKVSQFHRLYLADAVRSIGVQMREFKGEYHGYYDQAAPGCIRGKSGLCPIEVEEALAGVSNSSDHVAVFVSSLENRHVASLQSSMARLQEETGMRYLLFSQEGDGEQLDDVGHLKKALVDMWLLSLCDVLMTSHMSTFGYFAHALAGITPYHLKPWADDPCWLGVSSEPCFHFAPHKVVCKSDAFRVDDPFKQVPYLKPCPDMPRTGLQLAEV